jgi:hypothetical protein
LIKGARHKTQGVRPFGSSSKFKVQSLKFENAHEISQETWNLEPGTLILIELAQPAKPRTGSGKLRAENLS